MDTKHQVFVSSTYKDLIEERKAVIHALLELDCIPAGMELFPAADEDAWSLIKEVIDGCDYYVLILAGKYGSVSPSGISYTEMEFDYAVETNKPIIAFLHESVDALPSARVEKSEILQTKLEGFREKAKEKHCKFWSSAEDLGGKVSRSLVQLRKRHPALGWVPGQFAQTEEMQAELLELRNKVASLQAIVDGDKPPLGSEKFAQGDDEKLVPCYVNQNSDKARKRINLRLKWDDIFSYCGPAMVNECTDADFVDNLKLLCLHSLPKNLEEFNSKQDIVLPTMTLDAIKVQLQAIGLMVAGVRKRAVVDNNQYWGLTPYGKKYLVNIKAVKRSNVEEVT